MGLLDEAIRDHLELKRSRGADPTDIARAEREALEPVFPGEPHAGEAAAAVEGVAQQARLEAEHETGSPVADPAADAPAAGEPPEGEGFPTPGQETAELDMEAHMAQDAHGDAPAQGGPAPEPSDEELLEWEEPSAAPVEQPPAQIPGQERLSLE